MRAAALALVLAACGSGGGFPDAARLPPDAPLPGSFSASWTVVDAQHRPVTCAQAGATQLLVAVRDPDTGDELSATFPCAVGSGVSGAIAAGSYDLAFTLAGSAGAVATSPPQTGVAIAPGQTAMLMPIMFVVPGA